MKDALLIELAQTWELQASTGGDGLNMLQPATRETLRQCADVLRMLVDAQSAAPSPAPAVQPAAIAELVEALRNGHNLLTLATAFTSRQARDQCSGTLQTMWTLIAKHGQPQGGKG